MRYKKKLAQAELLAKKKTTEAEMFEKDIKEGRYPDLKFN